MRVSLKKNSQLKSDIRSCRCKNFSLKQASGLIRGNRTPWVLPLDLPLHNNNVNSLEVGGKSLKSFEE